MAAPAGRRRFMYLAGASLTALSVFLLTPFVETIGSHPLWTGPTIPVLGTLDVDARGAGRRRGRGSAPAGRLARLRRLCAADRPRSPAVASVRSGRARRSRSCLPHDSSRRSSGTPRVARSAARPGGRGRGCPRPRAASVPARVGLARTRVQPRRVDGGSRLRATRRDARAQPAVASARLARTRCGGSVRGVQESCGSSLGERPVLLVSGRKAGAARTCRSSSSRARSLRVLGPSGSGKSTLVRALAGLVPHFHGGRF